MKYDALYSHFYIRKVFCLCSKSPPPVAGDSTCGQRALYPVGMTGIPIVNVNNNCATGSSALYLAFQAIRGGQTHCALALGFEKMQRGSLSSQVRRLVIKFYVVFV